MKLLLILLPLLCAAQTTTRPGLGDFDHEVDVGVVPHPGSCVYSAADHAYRITGSGANIWGAQDAFHFVYRKLSGDLTLSADIHFMGQGKDGHRKACLMVRQSLAADAPYADVAVHGDRLISLQLRKTPGGPTTEVKSALKAPATVRIQRTGNRFRVVVTPKDAPAQTLGPVTVDLKDPVYCGLAVSSHDADVSETAVFSDTSLATPPTK